MVTAGTGHLYQASTSRSTDVVAPGCVMTERELSCRDANVLLLSNLQIQLIESLGGSVAHEKQYSCCAPSDWALWTGTGCGGGILAEEFTLAASTRTSSDKPKSSAWQTATDRGGSRK